MYASLTKVCFLISFCFQCSVSLMDKVSISKDGDYIIEFILSLHDGDCTDGKKPLSMINVLAVEAIVSIIDDINRSRDLLPNITLGYIIHDDYGSKRRATEIAMSLTNRIIKNEYARGAQSIGNPRCNRTRSGDHWINQQRVFDKSVIAVVGGSTSDMGVRIATVLRPIGIPVISYLATSENLRSVNGFPFMVSLLPSDKYQAKAIMDLTDEFKWSYVLALVTTSYYGIEGLAMLEKEAAKRMICLHSQTILMPMEDTTNNTSIRKAIEQIKKDKRLTVVIVFMYIEEVRRLFQEVERQNVTGITWIASEAWAENEAILNFPPRIIHGSLGVKLSAKLSSVNKRLCRSPHLGVNIWLLPFLCQHHNISRSDCSLATLFRKTSSIHNVCFQNLFPSSVMYIWSFAENTVRAVAQALDDLVSGSNKGPFDYTAMLKSIKSVHFVDSESRDVEYTNYVGPSVVNYTVVNLQSVDHNGRLKFIQVGSWAKDLSKLNKTRQEMFLRRSSIEWNTGRVPESRCSKPCPSGYRTNQGLNRCCWHCEPCPPDNINNSSMPHLCIKCPAREHPHRNRKLCVADRLVFFRYNQPIGIAVLSACGLGEVLGFALFAIFSQRRWKTHRLYTAMPFQKVSSVLAVVGFLPPLIFLPQTSLLICHLRSISFILFLNTHAFFLLCSCGRVRHLVVRLIESRRRPKKMMLTKKWTRSMRLKYVKKRKPERGEGGGEGNVGFDDREGYRKTDKGEVTGSKKEKLNGYDKEIIKQENGAPTSARKKTGSENEADVRTKEENGEDTNARSRGHGHVTPTAANHLLLFSALVTTSLPLFLMKRGSLIRVGYEKLNESTGYCVCNFAESIYVRMFPAVHLPQLLLTLVLTNRTKGTHLERGASKGSVDVTPLYAHDRFVYYLSYLMLLVESTCFPFSFLLPGPLEKDILLFTVTILVQYSFLFINYGAKLYVLFREQYKNTQAVQKQK